MAVTIFKDNRSPSLFDTIRIAAVAFDLTGSSVKLRMRAEGSSTLVVDTAATIIAASTTLSGQHILPDSTIAVASSSGFLSNGALSVGGQIVEYDAISGNTFMGCSGGDGTIASGATVAQIGGVRYDWAALDVATAGDFVAWWQVTLPSTKTQDTPDFEVIIVEHAPASNVYVQREEFKATLSLAGESFANEDIDLALQAASRAIDEMCQRRFYADSDAAQVRYYSPSSDDVLYIDDLVTLTSLKTDEGGDGVFETTWTLNTDFTREPLNAAADGKPWTKIRVHPAGGKVFTTAYPRTVEVTGKFGWTTPPAAIAHATTILAHRLLKRAREVPFGIAGIGLDGSAVRIAAADPDVLSLVQPFSRRVMVS